MRHGRRTHAAAAEPAGHERWLISYSDFMTLLFAFFVVLFAATYRDNQVVRKLSRAIHNGFQTLGAFSADESGSGGPYSTTTLQADDNTSRVQNDRTPDNPASAGSVQDMLQLRRQLEAAIGKELENHEIVLQVTPEGFVISLKELGFFDSGRADLLPGAGQKIERIARVLERPGLEIRVEGHSDNQPIHSGQYRSNWELSTARAMTVLQLLVSDGFDPRRLSASGYGEYRPIADNATPAGRRMNRRVDLVVVQARQPVPDTPSISADEKKTAVPDAAGRTTAM
ncbi:MAG: flagellar motor protein MotB [Terracidiphilus sp.]|jgi:chemotaxis protein MotB